MLEIKAKSRCEDGEKVKCRRINDKVKNLVESTFGMISTKYQFQYINW